MERSVPCLFRWKAPFGFRFRFRVKICVSISVFPFCFRFSSGKAESFCSIFIPWAYHPPTRRLSIERRWVGCEHNDLLQLTTRADAQSVKCLLKNCIDGEMYPYVKEEIEVVLNIRAEACSCTFDINTSLYGCLEKYLPYEFNLVASPDYVSLSIISCQ